MYIQSMNMDSTKEGYILCCFGDILYFKLTKKLIANIRQYDKERYFCVLTDNVTYFDETYITENKVIVKPFDYRNHVIRNVDMNNDWNKYGLIPKLFHSYYTPFEHTMFLDVDMNFKEDFTFFWDAYYKSEKSLLYAGRADEHNRAPSNWHWTTINEVIVSSGINIPEFFGVLIVYDKNLRVLIDRHLDNILKNAQAWRIKSWFRGGIPEEIIYAVICGIEVIRPNMEINSWILESGKCDPFDKSVG